MKGDDGLVPVAAATKGNASDTPDIIKMLVRHGTAPAIHHLLIRMPFRPRHLRIHSSTHSVLNAA